MKRIIFLLAAVFGCLQSSYGVVSDLPDREGPVDFATDITDRADVQTTPRVVTCSTQKVLSVSYTHLTLPTILRV